MSKLYLTEKGHVIPTLCEELTTWRRARKVLHLPPTASPATLYFLARPYTENPNRQMPLHLCVNGAPVADILPKTTGGYCWYNVPLDPLLLRPGNNTFEFWTAARAMNAWSLALEAGHAEPESWISDDGGQSWRNEKMGYLNALRGEYVVRARLTEGQDPPPPALVWEDPHNPRLENLREIMPQQALGPGSLLERVRALTAWLSSSWEHTNSARAAQYGPWDAETILAWGKTRSGHHGQVPILMCVHYAVALVSCCQAAGIPARCAVFMGPPDTPNGHFVNEVWFDAYAKWVMVDPNLDAIMWQNGVPLSVTEIQEAGPDLSDLVEWGPGIEFQRSSPHIDTWIKDIYLPGICFKRRSVWWRVDLLSHPEHSPPGHGSTAYCETGLVWEKHDQERSLEMFPYFAEPAYFNAPPPKL